jgi:hypothetical protein
MPWRHRAEPAPELEPEPAEETSGEPQQSILDSYVRSAPSAQNAVDIFEGDWSSALPLPGVISGPIPLFADSRVAWAIERFGGVEGRSVLELGPLEGGHSWMLAKAGARVTAIESQTRAYLRCLIAKELMGMTGVRFLLGDFNEYLRADPEHFDACVASGVLYHMRNPVETIELMAGVADRLFLWTHYYDEQVIRSSDLLSPRFTEVTTSSHAGFEHTMYRFDYAQALDSNAFCGGGAVFSSWLTRDELLAALEFFGWSVDAIEFETTHEHPHGPALCLVASKRS